MPKCSLSKVLTFCFSFLMIIVFASVSFSQEESREFEIERGRVLSYIMRQHLSRHHFSQKPFDDNFSSAAFNIYLGEVDYQKRFLTTESVLRLRTFEKLIDDEMALGQINLPETTFQLMEQRIAKVQKIVDNLSGYSFDFLRKETFEIDPEKRKFCRNDQELKDRWRKILKYQIELNYLSSLKENGKSKVQSLSTAAEKKHWKEAREKAFKSFRNLLFRMSRQELRTFYSLYFNAVAKAFDPHTNYLDPNMEEDFDISMKGSLEGIGASLREKDGYIKVVEIIPGSAAARQGQLAKEDVILKVAQGREEPVDVTEMRLREAVKLIRGKKGTEVRLTTQKPNGNILVIPIILDVVKIEDTFVKSAYLETKENGARFGYIQIPAFYRDLHMSEEGQTGKNSTDDFQKALRELKDEGIQGLIVDLRNDGGGALQDAVNIAGLFIESGPVVQVKDGGGEVKVLFDQRPSIEFKAPLVILVNKFSASASEILAGAMQDYRRAIIIGGEHTHGKGTVQALIDLDQGFFSKKIAKYQPLGALKVTIQKFYRISGDSTQYRGVIPDIVLPDRLRPLKSGEKYLDYSLPWDRVEAIDFQNWPRPNFVELQDIRRRSEQRTGKAPVFSKILQDIELEEKQIVNTLKSLEFNVFQKERQELDELQMENKTVFDDFVVRENRLEGSEGTVSNSELAERLVLDPYVREAFFVLKDLSDIF
jgi:carboxyl-terminal processing protease